jgi:hypothetical protein
MTDAIELPDNTPLPVGDTAEPDPRPDPLRPAFEAVSAATDARGKLEALRCAAIDLAQPCRWGDLDPDDIETRLLDLGESHGLMAEFTLGAVEAVVVNALRTPALTEKPIEHANGNGHAAAPPEDDWSPPAEIPAAGQGEAPAVNKSMNGQPLKLTYFRECDQAGKKQWLIKGVLAANETSTLIGPPGAGKSALATDIAIHYTQGKDWRGHRIKELGGVCYFAFERADLVKRRLYGYRLRDNLPPDLPIAVSGQIINLMDPSCVDLLLPALKAAEQDFGCAVRVAVFDTYNKGIAFGGGDEDKAKDQNRALGHLRRLQEIYSGLHVMAVGHTGKDEGRGARGSNALPGDADMQNQISTVGEVKIVTTMKANDAPIGELLRFKLEPYVFGNDEDGDPISAHIVASEIIAAQLTPLKKATAAPREGRAVRALRDAIIEVLDGRAETIQIANGQKVKAAAVENVQAEFTKRYVVSEDAADPDARRRKNDAKRKAFDRALDRLAGEFIGCVVGDRQWIYRMREQSGQ